MKIIDILAAQKDCVENYAAGTLLKPSIEESNCESIAESWSGDESDSDEDDELNLSFREGMKRTASDEFCHDLKRIKFDNNVRDLTDNFTFQLDLVLSVDTNKSGEAIRNNNVTEPQSNSKTGAKRGRPNEGS
jgi:hypothetical protein